MTIRPVTEADTHALAAFFGSLSERDLTLIREDLTDHSGIAAAATREMRWIDVDDSGIGGYVAVERLGGWSNHVGELRLVVGPDRRGQGVGRTLAQYAVAQALRNEILKVVVELVADSDGAVAMFSGLGFTGEALLSDHIRDRAGQLHDLVVLAHNADENWSTLNGVGIADAALS